MSCKTSVKGPFQIFLIIITGTESRTKVSVKPEEFLPTHLPHIEVQGPD